jgi:alanine dehydrogenase
MLQAGEEVVMRIGIPREIKTHEYRVGLTPAAVRELVQDGHAVSVERGAGDGAGFPDRDFEAAGATIAVDAESLYRDAQLIVKIKEPQPEEISLLRPDQLLFAFLHLAAEPQLARGLLARNVTAIAYETVTSSGGALPLLAPMSRIAGRMSVQAGAHCLEKPSGGRGVLLGGVPGVPPATVVVIGAGSAGGNAVKMAVGLQANVVVLDRNLDRLDQLAERFGSRIRTEFSTTEAIANHVADADLVIGAVLTPGRAAPKLLTRDMIAAMAPGSVLVDVSIDQGGCFATSRPTTHAEPTFEHEGVLHYCVTNMPGAVPRTATQALVNVTLPYVRSLASLGLDGAFERDPGFAAGLNVRDGKLCHEAVAADLQAALERSASGPAENSR